MEYFSVARTDRFCGFPDVANVDGVLHCVFLEADEHALRGQTALMLTTSEDRGHTWSEPRPLASKLSVEKLNGWNCPRLTVPPFGDLMMVCDLLEGPDQGRAAGRGIYAGPIRDGVWHPRPTGIRGMGPDRILADGGSWLLASFDELGDEWVVRCHESQDRGATWKLHSVIYRGDTFQVCEPSLAKNRKGDLFCFMRDNRPVITPAYASRFDGHAWNGPEPIALPGCQRPTAGSRKNGSMVVSFRSLLSEQDTNVFLGIGTKTGWRVRPIDYDRSPTPDCGYTGWCETEEGIYVVYYIVDDAPRAQIRGCLVRNEDLVLGEAKQCSGTGG